MDKIWVNNIISGKKKFSDIANAKRQASVRALMEQMVANGEMTQEDFDRYINGEEQA